jgi:molybdopterin-binding protein
MKISARNQLKGTITAVTVGAVMAEVTVDVGGGNTLVSAITRGSVESLALREGVEVLVVIKATEVLIGIE